jgi:glycosyltransferase involved in cell wall biosynthesis
VNLAILIGRFPPGVVGGAELQAETWAKRLAARHRVTVITRRLPPDQPARERREGFDVVRLPVAGMPLWRTLRDLGAIEREVAELAPRPDALLCFQTFVSGLAGVRVQRRLGVPAIVWIRGESELRTGARDRARWIAPRVWGAAAAVLVQSERVRGALLAGLERVAPALVPQIAAKLEVVPNGIELPADPPGPGRGVLAVGRLIRDKGMDTVIEAAVAAGLPLTIAGDGPERAGLEALAAARGGAVSFLGMVGRERLAELYREAGCVVLAARRGEGLPNVLLEAMAHGRPVVATPVMGVGDLVAHEVNGLLVSPDDAGMLAGALARLAGDAALAARLSAGARATAESFAWERVEPRLEAVLARWGATAHA